MSKKVLVLLAEGFEPLEAIGSMDVMLRAELDVTIAAVGGNKKVTSSLSKISLDTDILVEEVNAADYDAVVMPGGIPGSTNLQTSPEVIKIVQDMNAQGKYVCAMCAAPIVLATAGVLEGKNFTCYPAFLNQINAGKHIDGELAVTDGNVITAIGPAAAAQFGFAIVTALLGADTADAIAKGMLYK